MANKPPNDYYRQRIINSIWNNMNPNMTIDDVQKSFAAAGIDPVKPGEVNPQEAYRDLINRRQQAQIKDAYKNMDSTMSIEDFMDQFVGVDGQTQMDIDGQKLRMRSIQNKNAGISEQRVGGDIWDYINNGNVNASIEDVQKSFEAAGVQPVKPGEINPQEAHQEMIGRKQQSQIEDAYKNINNNTTIEEFMDQFVGVDGQTQQDIDAMKLSNRVKQNKRAGLSEQESIEDVQKSFADAGVKTVEPSEELSKQISSEIATQKEQKRIGEIWDNLDPNMSVENFMDQFVGIDGVTQQDIDRQKLVNRVKQNRTAGLSEQEAIDDMWNYVNSNGLTASVEDVQKSFEVARGERPESDLKRSVVNKTPEGASAIEEAAAASDVVPKTEVRRYDASNPHIDTTKIKSKYSVNKILNDDGSIFNSIDLGDGRSASVTIDANGAIRSKTFRKKIDDIAHGYAMRFNEDGKVAAEGFIKNDKDWMNKVYYDSNLKPRKIITEKGFDIDKAKDFRNEADAIFKQIGLDGINDTLPDFHYDPTFGSKINPNPELRDPTLHFNQPDYKKYQMNDVVYKGYDGPAPLPEEKPKISGYEKRMREYDDYIKEYEEMRNLVGQGSIVAKDGAQNRLKNKDKIDEFFGKDKFSIEDARLKYEEAKLYGRHRDDPNDPLRRNSKKWWDERDKLIKQRRALNKNRQSFIDSERIKRELADSEFLHEVAANRDIRDLLRTQSPSYTSTPEVAKSIKDSIDWLKDEENINRYNSIPEEFRNKIEGDIKKKRFELNKARRNAKLDTDYANFKSNYDKLTLSQKDEVKNLRQLESKYKSWQRTQGKGGQGKGDPAIVDDINKSKQKIKDLKAERRKVKKDMKRTSVKTRDRASNIKEEIGNLKNQIDDNQMFNSIQKAYLKENAQNPTLTFDQYLKDNYKNTRFENFNPKHSYEVEQLKDQLQFHKDLLKEKAGIDIAKEEGDIVERALGKLKGASKLDIAMSGIGAISKYKDSRKEGRGVVSSGIRAGADFVASQVMGVPLYIGLTAIRVAPKAIVNGALYLQNETRQMNTASRFRVFGDASFQDSDNLATMRQSGMEMAKMANYNLEQTLMGNEARYLHR